MRGLLVGKDAKLVGDTRGEQLAETSLDEVGDAELLEALSVVGGLESWKGEMGEEEGSETRQQRRKQQARRVNASEIDDAPSRVAANWRTVTSALSLSCSS